MNTQYINASPLWKGIHLFIFGIWVFLVWVFSVLLTYCSRYYSSEAKNNTVSSHSAQCCISDTYIYYILQFHMCIKSLKIDVHGHSYVLGKYWLVSTAEQSFSNPFLDLCKHLTLNTLLCHRKTNSTFSFIKQQGCQCTVEIKLLFAIFSKHFSLSPSCSVSGTFLYCRMTGTQKQPAK